ncbi:PD-(D/E)XK nuclease family protein [Cyclobacterium sp. 1_MG-2023]|uniref:PD-(D/E)XK nuclease family protein n=1 Tax=Cyclobacterium sp. 1_MG-2023 TaxID=3062681 RepID=UPI0026E39DAE|nr:PD-(D/E)XK nuclease family protein [Cyclobacterium sp. 1_MG-2023]MDO6439602.1 PD-(D/E)XK nuclease family protein [Cyclobacterium sp. 1_MG-2023]
MNSESLEISEIRELIKRFNNDAIVAELSTYYSTKSFSEILGVSRKEAAHNNFLSWIFNPNESHQIGDFAVRKLLNLIFHQSKRDQLNLASNFIDSIIVEDYELKEIETFAEKSVGKYGRLDILIQGEVNYSDQNQSFKVIIENKVGSVEHSDQTNKYFNYFEGLKDSNCTNIYVFLTPISSLDLIELDEPECTCKSFIQINYQLIADSILEPILNTNISGTTRYIVRDYLNSLSQPSINEDDEYKQGLIMALGNKERELLSKFWDKNEKLILASLYAMTTDPKVEPEVREQFKSTLDQLQGSTRDRSLYNIYYDERLIHKEIKKSDIGRCTVDTLEKFNLINHETFQLLKNDRTSSFDLLKQKNEVTENEEKYRKYRINHKPEFIYNDTEYYIARNWGKDNTERFTNKMTGHFPKLQFENIK